MLPESVGRRLPATEDADDRDKESHRQPQDHDELHDDDRVHGLGIGPLEIPLGLHEAPVTTGEAGDTVTDGLPEFPDFHDPHDPPDDDRRRDQVEEPPVTTGRREQILPHDPIVPLEKVHGASLAKVTCLINQRMPLQRHTCCTV